MDEKLEYVNDIDFMRMGQAIAHEQWQVAFMTLRRLEQRAKELGISDFGQQFLGLRYAIQREDIEEAKQVLTVITNKRVRVVNERR